MYGPSPGCPQTYQETILMRRGFWGGLGGRDLVFIMVGDIPLDIMANKSQFHHGALL